MPDHYIHVNNASTTVAVARSAGGATLSVASGVAFGTPTTSNPIRLSIFRDDAPLVILEATARSGNDFTITGAIEGTTDQDLQIGDVVENTATAGDLEDLWTGLGAVQAAIPDPAPTLVAGSNITLTPSTGTVTITAADQTYDDSDVVKLDGTQTLTGANTFTHAIDGDITGNAATADFAHNAHVAETLLGLDPAIFGGELVAIGSSGTGFEVGNPGVVRVAMTVPSGLSVSGSPVTSTGTLAIGTTLDGIVKGNGTGFEAAVAGTDYATPDQIPEVPTLVAGDNITLTPGAGTVTIAATDQTGVTSVAMSVPSGLSVSGSPVTSSGTLAVTTTLSGIVKGNGTGFVPAVAGTDYSPPLVAGSNVTLTTGTTGTVTIAATGGTGGGGSVTSVAMTVPSGLSVSGSPVTTSGTLAVTTTLSGIVKGDGSGFTTATAGTDYVSPSGLTTTLGGYVDTTSWQTITGQKTFGLTTIVSNSTTDKVTSSSKELVIEQTGDQLGTTRLHLQGRAGLTGALFECATGYDVIDFGFKSGSYTRALRAEYRSGSTYSGGPEFTLGDNSDGINAFSTFFTGDNFSGFFGNVMIAPKSSRAFGMLAPKVSLDVRGGMSLPFRVVSGNATVTLDDYQILVNGNTTAVTITLPEAGFAGVRFVISDSNGTAATNNITINVTGGHYLNASQTAVINTNYGQLEFVCTGIGSNYYYPV